MLSQVLRKVSFYKNPEEKTFKKEYLPLGGESSETTVSMTIECKECIHWCAVCGPPGLREDAVESN
jgi:hypothetical protein